MASKKRVAKKTKKAAKRKPVAPRRKRAVAAAKPPAGPNLRTGTITHTELASADPSATQAWCRKALGWKFQKPVPTPTGPYHMWQFATGTGGGIRSTNISEAPGTTPYVEVASINRAFAKALAAGASTMLAPQEIPGNMGWIGVVMAPGGVPVGFWSMKK